jgi:hypothetical protein
MNKRNQALEEACTANGWYAYHDKDCEDRYLVGLPPKDDAALQEKLTDIANPRGTIYGWDAIGGIDYVTAWISANPYSEVYNPDGSRTERAIVNPPRSTAYVFTTVTVTDPLTGNPVELSVYLHPNGGIFGIDAAFLTNGDGSEFELVDPEDGDSDIIMFDPFCNSTGYPSKLKVRCSEKAPEEYAPYYTAEATS